MSAQGSPKARRMLKAMREAARVASVMVDGEEAKAIIVERAYRYMAQESTAYRHMAGDYFDVEAAPFLRMKKTLQRLTRLLEFPVGTSLWVPVRNRPEYVTVALHNGNLHRYWTFGQDARKADGDLGNCLRSGALTTVTPADGDPLLTVLAPVRDSLGDVSGVVEITAMNPATKALAPAWS